MPILTAISYRLTGFTFYRLLKVPAITLGLLIIQLTSPAQTPSREYQLKAVFLFNFTQFVDWPPNAFETAQSALVIGILGDNPFGSYLEQTVSGEKINGHSVVVRYFKSVEEAERCHVLFINVQEAKKLRQATDAVKGLSVLSVGDTPDFSKQGGMIRLFTINNKIKLEINLEACKESELVVSSKLLRLAEIFKPEANK